MVLSYKPLLYGKVRGHQTSMAKKDSFVEDLMGFNYIHKKTVCNPTRMKYQILVILMEYQILDILMEYQILAILMEYQILAIRIDYQILVIIISMTINILMLEDGRKRKMEIMVQNIQIKRVIVMIRAIQEQQIMQKQISE